MAARTAVQPDCFWTVNQTRRGVAAGYDSGRLHNQNCVNGTESQYEAVCQKYPGACAGLNDPITAEEVVAALGKLKDVGAGPDGMPPIVLRAHSNHVSCPVVQQLLHEFNVVFAMGVVPATGNSTDYSFITRVIMRILGIVTVIEVWAYGIVL